MHAFAQERASDVGGAPARRRVTALPKLTHFVEAIYPPEKKSAGATASVLLTIEISATGAVTNVAIAKSASPDFDAAAIAAATQFVFEPAEIDEKPAPAKITYRYDFTMSPTPTPTRSNTPTPSPSPPPNPNDAEVRASSRRGPNTVRVTAEEGRRVAGTQGDVLKVVQNLPGVSRPPLASGQLVVWGSAPNETRVMIDGVEIPALYHGSGLRSVVSSDLVSSIDLTPGAFGAEYGRGLGGLVRVDTRAIRADAPHAFVAADTLDASASASTPLGKNSRLAIYSRYSYLDALVPVVTSKDVGDTFPIPRYGDYQAKLTLEVAPRASVDVVALGSFDALDRTVGSPDPASVRTESTRDSFHRVYLRYLASTADAQTSVTPFFGYDDDRIALKFGGTPATQDVSSFKYGLRAARRERFGEHVHVTAGLDALGAVSTVDRAGSLTLPPREGDVTVFGQPPGDDVATDHYQTHILNVGPSLATDVVHGPISLTLGVRMENFLIEGSRQTPNVASTPEVGFSRLGSSFDPRGVIRARVAPGLSLAAAAGIYHQAPAPEDLSAVLGTPALGVSKATHVSLAQEVRLTDALDLEVTEFYKQLADLTVRTELAAPILARALVQNGQGQSYGVQMLLRQEMTKGFFGWVSYTMSRSERRYLGDSDWRAFDFDQPHVLAVVFSYEIAHFTFGARFRASSGYPRTPVVGAYYDARNDRYDPLFGPQNSIRLPAFYQLDAKIERAFQVSNRVKVTTFVDVENVTAHTNAEEYVYSFDYAKRDVITGLPTIAVVGVRADL